jgi:polyisoprenoid-binding protein YceI
VFRRIAAAVLMLSLAACAAPRPRPPLPQAPTAAVLTSLPAPGEYKIDSGNSELRLLVYRAGPLSNLGHNHVMVNRELTGIVRIGDGISASSFSLRVPVDAFVVDESIARQEEGGDFPGEIPQEAKAGTRRNMLSAAVLNGAQFPDITVKSVALAGTLDALSVDVEISAAGHSSTITAPLNLQGDAHRLTAIGSMELRQTALGLTPYSLMGGALQVQDAMQLKFKITLATN